MTASASPPPSVTVTLPSSTSTFHCAGALDVEDVGVRHPGGLRRIGPGLEILEELLHGFGHLIAPWGSGLRAEL